MPISNHRNDTIAKKKQYTYNSNDSCNTYSAPIFPQNGGLQAPNYIFLEKHFLTKKFLAAQHLCENCPPPLALS